jgi:hypothetical protein
MPRVTVDELLEQARRDLVRLGPEKAREAVAAGATLIDIRAESQRRGIRVELGRRCASASGLRAGHRSRRRLSGLA